MSDEVQYIIEKGRLDTEEGFSRFCELMGGIKRGNWYQLRNCEDLEYGCWAMFDSGEIAVSQQTMDAMRARHSN